jgi:hypothetical protein
MAGMFFQCETESSKALGNYTSVSMKFVRFSLLSNLKLFFIAEQLGWAI